MNLGVKATLGKTEREKESPKREKEIFRERVSKKGRKIGKKNGQAYTKERFLCKLDDCLPSCIVIQFQ